MCNWTWGLGTALGPFGAAGGAVIDYKKDKKLKNQRNEEMARSQSLQDKLTKTTKDYENSLDSGEAVSTTDRVLSPDDKKKQTIKSLNIPLNTGSSVSGLNV